jgi:hypothetical protein
MPVVLRSLLGRRVSPDRQEPLLVSPAGSLVVATQSQYDSGTAGLRPCGARPPRFSPPRRGRCDPRPTSRLYPCTSPSATHPVEAGRSRGRGSERSRPRGHSTSLGNGAWRQVRGASLSCGNALHRPSGGNAPWHFGRGGGAHSGHALLLLPRCRHDGNESVEG